ncbi:MAG: endonuclease/exonuclease/phosphatase family protein, partial [Allobaculum sp.]|nr:endonuclease/exonuclease/phosphatase family protein [Allobaculum sp.]
MKLITWNVNGYRAMKKKGLETLLDFFDADIVCLQEIKATADQIDLPEELYPYLYVNAAKRKGYSGTLVASRYPAQEVMYGLGQEELDHEGRIITCVFENFTLVNVYTPNSQQNLKRIDFRLAW